MTSSLPVGAGEHKPKLLDQVRQLMRLRHYSLRTEEAYVGWIRRYILFHGKRHPRDLGEEAVSKFLSSLAIESPETFSRVQRRWAEMLAVSQPTSARKSKSIGGRMDLTRKR